MLQYYPVVSTDDPDRPERPEYNVYRGGSGGRSRGRKAEQPPQRGAAPSGDGTEEGKGYTVYKARRGFKRPSGDLSPRDRFRRGDRTPRPPGERPLWRRVLKWAALRARRVAAAQPRPLRGLGADPEGQAGRFGRRRHRRLSAARRLTADDPGDGHRRAPGGQRRGRRRDRSRMPGEGGHRRRDRERLRGAVAGRHADARARRRGRLREALDSARHAGRHPGRGRAEDQRRLRVRRRQAPGRDHRELPRHRHRPRRDPRLRGLRRLHRLARRCPGGAPRAGQVEDLGRRRQRRGVAGPRARQGRPERAGGARARPHPREPAGPQCRATPSAPSASS